MKGIIFHRGNTKNINAKVLVGGGGDLDKVGR
jgi:hypothetical protein